MIYTVGLRRTYEEYLKFCSSPCKLGQCMEGNERYPGGSVWQTRKEAQDYLERTKQPDFAVYGVLADWDTQTEPSENEWNNLLVTSPLVSLDTGLSNA